MAALEPLLVPEVSKGVPWAGGTGVVAPGALVCAVQFSGPPVLMAPINAYSEAVAPPLGALVF